MTPLDTQDTERALLGAMLRNGPEKILRAAWDAGLTASDFSRPQHGYLFDVIARLVKTGQSVDAVSLINELRRDVVPMERGRTVPALDYCGGATGILGIEEHAGVSALASQYASEIVSQALSREMIRVGEDLQQQGASLTPISEAVTAAERRLAHARDRAEGRHTSVRKADVAEALQRLLEDYISDDPEDLFPFAQATLNAIGAGMAPGDVVVVGARSGVGKTWWGLDEAERCVASGRRAVIFSLEMPQRQIVRRLMARGGISLTGLRKRAVPYDTLTDRADEIDRYRGLLDIEDGPTTVDRVQSLLASARIDGNPYRLVVIDHLHLMDVPGGRSEYRIALNQELTRIKHLASEHGCTIILLAQLNRPKKGDEAKRPTIHDLRESGGIGDIADYVLLLHREPDEQGHATNRGVIVVDKVRDGFGACDIDVTFDPRTYTFREGWIAGISHAAS
jgi:replicative DNA helicase